MGTDEDFERRLGARLHHAVDDVYCAPGLGAAVRRRHERHMVAVRTAMVTPAAAAAVAVGAAALSPGSAVRPSASASVSSGGAAATGTTDLRDAVAVSARTATALADVDRYVIRTRTVSSGSATDSLVDRATGRTRLDTYDPAGARLESIGITSTSDGGLRAVVVEYRDRAWWTWSSGPEPGQPAARTVGLPRYADPVEIRKALHDGTIRMLGEETLNGRHALHLRLTFPPKGTMTAVLDLWVDAESYLPYRATTTTTGTKERDRSSGHTVDYTWLARTPAHLARLTVTPPAAFTRHAKPIRPKASGTPRG
jgi:hypothetical protein